MQYPLRVTFASSKVAIAIRREFVDLITVVVMGHVVPPVVPKFFHWHTLRRIFREIDQFQAASITLAEFFDPLRFFWLMEVGAIGHDDDPALALG